MTGKERGGRVAGREGARLRGRTPGVQKVAVCGRLQSAEGCGLWLVEEEEPFCLGGKVHRRTSWVEQAWHREDLL